MHISTTHWCMDTNLLTQVICFAIRTRRKIRDNENESWNRSRFSYRKCEQILLQHRLIKELKEVALV